MVGLGLAMIAAALAAVWLRRRGTLFTSRRFARAMLVLSPTGFVALLAGWVTTEAGRQPWVVYGVMRTAHAVSPVSAQQVQVSLLVLVLTYCLVFGTGLYYLLKWLRVGPVLPGEPSAASDSDHTSPRGHLAAHTAPALSGLSGRMDTDGAHAT